MKPEAYLFAMLVSGLAACASAPVGAPKLIDASTVEISEIAIDQLPADVAALIASQNNGFEIEEILKKVRDGRVYYDVEGETPADGEIEYDILLTKDGPRIMEIQRDIAWSDAPEVVRMAAIEAYAEIAPVRVIESKQPDGAIIYELFAKGKPSDPSMEVKLLGEEVEVLTERWPH